MGTHGFKLVAAVAWLALLQCPRGALADSALDLYCAATGERSVCSNEQQYSAGSIAELSGDNHTPNSDVTIRVTRPDGSVVTGDGSGAPWPTAYDTVATDEEGRFVFDYTVGTLQGVYQVDVLEGAVVTASLTFGGTGSAVVGDPDGVPDTGIPAPRTVDNPPLASACGLDIVLVIDTSGSVDNSELAQAKAAFIGFVDALLPDTPTEFAVVEFNTQAFVRRVFTNDKASIISAINAMSSGGYTNWDDALYDARNLFPNRADKPDLILFSSDGNPNRRGGHLGQSVQSVSASQALAAAVAEANAAKLAGIRIVALGIGDGLNVGNLVAISSADAVITSGFDTLADDLAQIALELCGGTITVTKLIDADGNLGTAGDRTPGVSWTFTTTVDPPDSSDPPSGNTDSNGQINFEIDTGADLTANLDIAESPHPGFTLLSAACTKGGSSVGTPNGLGVDNITITPLDIINCTFINTPLCGNGNLDPGEQCDDGNIVNGDCCMSNCQFAPVGSGCGNFTPQGACDLADVCDSAGVCLPNYLPSATECRASTGACDAAEFCTGTEPACPPDEPAADGEPCDDDDACTADDACWGGVCTGGPPLDCDDGLVCTNDSCNPAIGCVYTNNNNPCDDGDACTTADTCSGGVCVGGPALNCDDSNVCTDDSCDPGTGCAHADNTAPCNDGNACTTNDTCSGGACAGGPPPNCDDGNVCTTDSCNPATGCVNTNNNHVCDDSNACTMNDTCSGGACVGGPPPNCDDGNGCTDDSCNPSTGCVNANNTAPCNDANACTTGDTCAGGWCVGGPAPNCDDGDVCTTDTCSPSIGCVNTNNNAPCDDGDACTTDDTCSAGSCFGGPPLDCNDGNVCTDDSCDPGSGCVNTDNTVSCNDGDACTTNDTCSGGACVGGPPPNCHDGNVCTDDSCDPGTGCVNANNTAPCDDGNACTTGDTCSGGACAGGPPPDCSDGDVCTDDSCDPGSGCLHTDNAAPCDDGDACTTGDSCAGGTCIGGAAPNCDDGNDCTDDSCEPGTGCVNTDNTDPCDDGHPCTEDDVCAGGSCSGTPIPDCIECDLAIECDDGNECTDDDCVMGVCVNTDNTVACDDGNACTTDDACSGGSCVGGPAPDCDDGNVCTDDSCDPFTGCVNADNTDPCEDGDACTTADTCSGGMCVGGPAPNCDDGNVCTDDSCDPFTGCVNTDNTDPCDDGDACTTEDTCSGGMCVGGPAPDCDDGNVCTDDSCDPSTGCVYTDNTDPCDDGDACTTGDTCSGGACMSGPALDCDDGNVCTDDSCDPFTGCVNSNNTAPCDDGNACTTDDTCAGAACAGGPAPDCDDGNVCTNDSCNPSTGCVHTNNNATCDDGNACTTGDTCSGGACMSGPALDCDDGNVCTDDSCDPGTGCVHANNTAPCNDGSACTTADACIDGACVGGPAPNCDDSNGCTTDTCVPATGCVNTNNNNPCSDGNACTTADTCSGGACVGGPPLSCDDGNVCTNDSCNPSTGCVHANNTSSCNDGAFCTVNDACSGGQCSGSPRDCSDGVPCTADSCNETTNACVNGLNHSSCDDGNDCTMDTCTPTGCVNTFTGFCGACCMGAGGCSDGLSNSACSDLGGSFHAGRGCLGDRDGNGIDDMCDDQGVPTLSEWGMVVLSLLLLVGLAIKFGCDRRQVV